MDKVSLKDTGIKKIGNITNTLMKAIDKFPINSDWGDRHIHLALKKIIEKPDINPDQVVKDIKRSYLCNRENYGVDGDNEKTGM